MPPATDPAPSPQETSDALIGRIIKGRYRVVRLLGRGGMGNVYEVMHERLRSSFALKQLRADLASEPEIVARFRHEAEIMARLSHPHVARVFDIDAEPDVGSWMAMELVQGEDLGAVMRRVGRLPLGEAIRIGFQIATALDCAHRAGLVHRDIKPANVLIEAGTGRAVLTDFGIAKSLMANDADGGATRTGVFLGTYRYSSPEQLRNRRDVEIDGRADVYSLGVVLYEMVSGKKFLAGLTESDVLSEVGFDPAWHAPLDWDDPPPPALVALIEGCLEPQRDRRVAGADVVASTLAEIAASLPGGAPAPLGVPPPAAFAPVPTPVPAEPLAPPAIAAEAKRAPTAVTRPPRAAATSAVAHGGIQSASRAAPRRHGARRWWAFAVLAVVLGGGAALTLDDKLRALVGVGGSGLAAEIQNAQPDEKVVLLGRSEPRWFSVVVEGADPESPPAMRWYLNGALVAEGTTMWEYDPARDLQSLTAHGEVRFLLGSGRPPHQVHVWATHTTPQDLSPVLQSASYKPGSTIALAPGERAVIEVDARDPNGDPLTYTWRIDGRRVGGNEPRLEVDARRDAKVTLTISDGGAVVSSGWSIAVTGSRP